MNKTIKKQEEIFLNRYKKNGFIPKMEKPFI
jgi:hypothetical protein